MTDSKPHSDPEVMGRFRRFLVRADVPVFVEALDGLVEQYEDLLRQRIELQNSIGGYIVQTDELCRQRGDAWNENARLKEQLEARERALRTIVDEAERSLEVLPVTNPDVAYFEGRIEAANEVLHGSFPASRPS